MSIIEFGGGYGGLCNIISKSVKLTDYTFVEIEAPLELAKKCFINTDVNVITYLPEDAIKEDKKYDLFISEYGFCELNDDGMDKYICLLEKSNNAYLTMNLWDKNKKTKFKNKLNTIFDTVEEHPLYIGSEWGDYVLVCKGINIKKND